MTQATVDSFPGGARVIGLGPDIEPPEQHHPAAEGGSQGRNAFICFLTWLVTPHIEFGAIYVGMIVVLFLDMSLVQALIGIVGGTAVGAVSHGLLTATGVKLRVPPIALGRLAFGKRGNRIPTTIMAIVSSLGWFIVNSVVAALAFNTLFGIPIVVGLAIVVIVQLIIAQFGISYRALQRYLFPVVTVLLVVAGIIMFAKVDPADAPGSPWDIGGLIAIVVVGCIAWAYTIGWNPYATDYSGYAPTNLSPRLAGVCSALGLFCATTFLMMVGVAAAIVVGVDGVTNPTTQFTDPLPTALAVLVLLGLIAGSWSHNAITLKSSRSVFDVKQLKLNPALGVHLAEALMTLAAFFLGWAALADLPANFEGYIMVLGYWIAPWLNVILIDQYLRRKTDVTSLVYDDTMSSKWGLFSVLFALIGSICLWGLQIFDGGRLPHGAISYTALGMLVGFYLAGIIYGIGLKRMLKSHGAAAL